MTMIMIIFFLYLRHLRKLNETPYRDEPCKLLGLVHCTITHELETLACFMVSRIVALRLPIPYTIAIRDASQLHWNEKKQQRIIKTSMIDAVAFSQFFKICPGRFSSSLFRLARGTFVVSIRRSSAKRIEPSKVRQAFFSIMSSCSFWWALWECFKHDVGVNILILKIIQLEEFHQHWNSGNMKVMGRSDWIQSCTTKKKQHEESAMVVGVQW